MSKLQTPATEPEIADTIRVIRDVVPGPHDAAYAMVVRRLAFERDMLKAERDKLLAERTPMQKITAHRQQIEPAPGAKVIPL